MIIRFRIHPNFIISSLGIACLQRIARMAVDLLHRGVQREFGGLALAQDFVIRNEITHKESIENHASESQGNESLRLDGVARNGHKIAWLAPLVEFTLSPHDPPVIRLLLRL